MNLRKALSIIFLAFFAAAAGCAQTASPANPQVTVSPERVLHHDHIDMRGSGFTPKSNAFSHLRRPDGSEFPVLPIVTDDRGEFTHDIDTLLLGPGTFEVWVEDSQAKKTSNMARFEVTTTDPKAK